MSDKLFADARLAKLYNLYAPWHERADIAFYLPLLAGADSVLDLGCGTGALLRRARAEGHAGRLVGLDPAEAMLAVARESADVEWVQGAVGGADAPAWSAEFDLVVMTGHAFQVLLSDAEAQAALATAAAALKPGGRFAFETRNPAARAWEKWPAEYSGDVMDANGVLIHRDCVVDGADLDADGRISFTHTFDSPAWSEAETSRSTLRFPAGDAVSAQLAAAGFTIEEQFGDWDRSPVGPAGPELITFARKA